MRGLDDMEKLVIAEVRLEHAASNRYPSKEETDAFGRLLNRGVLGLGPMCMRCGLHPDIYVTPLGLEVERLDKMAREGVPIS